MDEFVFEAEGEQSFVLDLEPYNVSGYFSLQGKGGHNPDGQGGPDPFPGLIEVTYEVSNNGVDFLAPASEPDPIMSDIGDAVEVFASFSPPPCRYLKLIFTADDVISASF